jgi:hypothetical protein
MRLTIAHIRAIASAAARLLPLVLCLVSSQAAAQSVRETTALGDPFARRGWHLQLAGHAAIETWNYNVSHEELYGIVPGITYGVREGLTIGATGPLYYVSQRGVDAWLLGATIGVRGRVYRRHRWSLYMEFDVGVSEADTSTPPRGTRFNYLVRGGGGLTARVHPGIHLLAGLRWIHISNNGLAGRNRNPDIEAVGPQLGLLIAF